MRFIRRIFLAVFLLLTNVLVMSQDMLGTSLGNYAGIDGLKLNPSSIQNSKSFLDIRVIGLDVFLQNNYLFLKKSDYRFTNFFKSGYQWPTHPEPYGTGDRIFYHYDNLRNKNAFIQERVDGPGAMLIVGHHAFALTTAVRTVVALSNVPYELANFMYLGLNYVPQQKISYTDPGPVKAYGMTWGEIGLSYSHTFYATGYDVFSAGISVKRLLGIGGIYINARSIDYMVPDDQTLDVKNLDAEMGLALPVDYNTNTTLISPLFKGGGFGADLGITYTRLKKYHQNPSFNTLCAQTYEDYLYRIGIAFIDFGGINFKNNATRIRIDNRSSYWTDLNNLRIDSINELLDTISYKFYGNNTEAYAGNSFTMWLPAALSAQVDYHLRKFWYVNASMIYGISIARNSVARPAIVAVAPRYETRWFEASMPVSLYNWQAVRMGLALRIYWLSFGTEKLGGFLHFSDFTGLDFYASIKLFFNKGNCRDKGPPRCGGPEPKKIRY